jgi:very-short-patch-repair endonuclease
MGGSSARSADVAQAVQATTYPYIRSDRFLSATEALFLAALRVAVADEYEIFAKVRLLDLVRLTVEKGRQTAYNKVQAKEIDFLLCDRDTSRPRLAIELDDSTHQRADRQGRDAFVEQVLEVIGLPVVRFAVTRAYDPREVARLVKASIRA